MFRYLIVILLLLSQQALAEVDGSLCFNKKNLKISALPFSKNEDVSKVLIENNGKVIFSLESMLNDKKDFYFYQDIDFDNVDELFIYDSAIPENISYSVYKINCNEIIPFHPSYLTNFNFDKVNKTLNEVMKDGVNSIKNKYCFGELGYYLCNTKKTLVKYNYSAIWRSDFFDERLNNIRKDILLDDDSLELDKSINNVDLEKYNNIAYYLEQSGNYDEAILILEKIIKQYPKRTVAYINLGDAYWGRGERNKSRIYYKKYIEQMSGKGKSNRIPVIVKERVEGNL
ncbi:tetratricopeptide repeat protein [Pragia fontium]|uniref:tetratricopeptide repeat protein n=1 Tax=Pragia fontium TaxID=82985 RepID=UPI00069C7F4D|nr:tetratricopeptide repeat protein [Pragia fontium]